MPAILTNGLADRVANDGEGSPNSREMAPLILDVVDSHGPINSEESSVSPGAHFGFAGPSEENGSKHSNGEKNSMHAEFGDHELAPLLEQEPRYKESPAAAPPHDEDKPRFNFMLLVLVVYGFLQGGGTQFFSMGFFYYWKDTAAIDPDRMQRFDVLSSMPWDFKPIWGFLSDAFPPKSCYLRIGAWSAMFALCILAHSASMGHSYSQYAVLGTFMQANTALAIIDTMIDGMIVEEVRGRPGAASSIYTFGSLSHFACAAVAGLGKGAIQDNFGCSGQFLATAVILVVVAVSAMCPGSRSEEAQQKSRTPTSGGIKGVRASLAILGRVLVLPCVYQPMLYVFLSGALVPSFGAAYMYFLTAVNPIVVSEALNSTQHRTSDGSLDNLWPPAGPRVHPHEKALPGPGFTPEWLGFMSVVGSIMSSFGVLLYIRFLKHWSFRAVFALCHGLQVFFSLMDIIIVCRWNITVFGIPDKNWALVSDDVMHPLIKRIQDLPFQMFAAAALCPPGLEATVFALLYSCGHAGRDMGKWFGAQIMLALGTSKSDLSLLWLCVVIRSVLKIAPIIAVVFFIPNSTPGNVALPAEVRRAAQTDKEHD